MFSCVTFVEALTIYLSAGAPFAVLFLFSAGSKLSPATFVQICIVLLFWPLFGVSRIRRHLKRSIRSKNFELKTNSDSEHGPAADIWSSLYGHKFSIAERAVMDRYSELTLALASPGHCRTPNSDEFFEVAGHSNPTVGSACIARSRRAQIARSHAGAAQGLLSLLGDRCHDAALVSIEDHCISLGDEGTAAKVRSLKLRTLMKERAARIVTKSETESANPSRSV